MQFPCIPPHTHIHRYNTHTHTLWKKSNYSIADVQDIQLHFDPYSIPFCCSRALRRTAQKLNNNNKNNNHSSSNTNSNHSCWQDLANSPSRLPTSPLALLLASKSFSCMAFARASLDLVCCLNPKPSERARARQSGRAGERERRTEIGQEKRQPFA